MQERIWTIQEKLKVGVEAIEAKKRGDEAEYERIMKTIPIEPSLAKNAKECFGADLLIKSGYNLSEADAKFGPGWLTN
jgi:hypothetical protein